MCTLDDILDEGSKFQYSMFIRSINQPVTRRGVVGVTSAKRLHGESASRTIYSLVFHNLYIVHTMKYIFLNYLA